MADESSAAKRSSGSVLKTAEELAAPIAQSLGLILWDVELRRIGSELTLRYTIDRDGGLSIDECERFHRAVEAALDEVDPIDGPYTLECSSPGVERTLRLPRHFAASLGERAELRFYAPDASGRKTVTGTIAAADDDTVTFVPDGETDGARIPYASIAKAAIVFDWGTPGAKHKKTPHKK